MSLLQYYSDQLQAVFTGLLQAIHHLQTSQQKTIQQHICNYAQEYNTSQELIQLNLKSINN